MLFDPLIEIQNQILGQAVEIAGTGFRLHYRSDRVPGRRAAYSVKIPLSGANAPTGLKRIALEVVVAGRHFGESFPPAPGQSYTFTWDGQDASGRVAQGKQLARIRLGYVYCASHPRPELTTWQESSTVIGTWDSRALGLGGWTLSVHHAYDPAGRVLYVGDGRRRSNLTIDGGSTGEIAFPTDDGHHLYIFDRSGRQLRTVNVLTGALQYGFEYDATGRLAAIEDGDGNVTRIERNTEGTSTVIVAPYGQRTTLTTNAEGYLTKISNPAGEAAQFGYSNNGLLVSLATPKGDAHRFSYDEPGRLVRHEDPAGGLVQFVRSSIGKGFQVTRLTALNRESTYLIELLPTGEKRRVNKCCGGGQMVALVGMKGTRTINYPDGTVALFEGHPASGSGAQLSFSRRVVFTTPRGLARAISRTRSVTLANPNNPLDVATLTDTVEVNGRTYATTFNTSTKHSVSTTPSGRQILTSCDAQGRVTEEQTGNLLPVRFTYDDRGRIATVTQGLDADARGLTITHDAQGRIAKITDPLKRAVGFQYDEAGRVVKRTTSDGREASYRYDPNGNRTSLTPPGRPAHSFERTPVNLIQEYIPPKIGEGGGTTYTYNAHRQLTRIAHSDGVTIDLDYDDAGAPSTVTFPGGPVRRAYDPKTGNLTTITAPDGGVLSYVYDGFLLTSTAWTGTIKGNVSRSYDNHFRVATRGVNDGTPVDYKYDADGLLIQAGDLVLNRDAHTGLVTGTKLAEVNTSQDHNGFSEIVGFRAAFRGAEIFAVRYTRDPWGRISEKTETIDGETARYAYEYDPAGRLAEVTRNGVQIGHYTYDSNGNRLTRTGPDGTVSGTYDDQDRLTQYGTGVYNHTGTGERSRKIIDGRTVAYDYDVFGSLKGVSLPDGTKIEYLTDGEHRRIGKKTNGSVVQGLLYQDRLRPIAELDAQNNVVSRFIYCPWENTPAYMRRGDGTVHRIIADHLGSPRLVLDVASGRVMQRMDYDEYGNVLLDTNPGFQPFGFAGGIYDRDTGMVRFGARDYDPETGRWTAKDPILFAGGGTNLYEYALSDPVNLVDPQGLWTGIWPGYGPRWHHDRNVNQSCPPTSPPLYDGPSECPMEQTSTGWTREGRSPTHGGYQSYRHSDTGFQCVYDDNGNLLTDPENEGTYDYFPPYNPDGSISPTGLPAHFLFDVLPWVFWGNAR